MSSHSQIAPLIGLPKMPPQFKNDGTPFNPSDLRSYSIPNHSKDGLSFIHGSMSYPRHPASQQISRPQPFTASWLTEVANMTPITPTDRFSFPPPIAPPVVDYYQRPSTSLNQHYYYSPPIVNRPMFHPNYSDARSPSRAFPFNEPRMFDLTRTTPSNASTQILSLRPPRPKMHSYDIKVNTQPESNILNAQKLVQTNIHSCKNLYENFPSPQKKKHCAKPYTNPTSTKNLITTPSPLSSITPNASISKSHLKSMLLNKQNSLDAVVESSNSQQRESYSLPIYSHFQKGSLISLGRRIRRIEELQTDDFVEAATIAGDLLIEPSTIGSITSNEDKNIATINFSLPSRTKEMSVKASTFHPFFVLNCGWSSFNPEQTLSVYGLRVSPLKPGDICVSLKKKIIIDLNSENQTTNMPPPRSHPKTLSTPSTASSNYVTPPSFQLSTSSSNFPITSSQSFAVSNMSSVSFTLSSNSVTERKANSADITSSIRNNSTVQFAIKPKTIGSSLPSSLMKNKGRKRRWSDPDH